MPTLIELYRQETGDIESHHKTVHAAFALLPDRPHEVVCARMAGKTPAQLAQAYGLSRGAVRSVIRLAMLAMKRHIDGTPRYSVPRTVKRATKKSQARR
jgi:DNA-directed RNA polymerase specialized sigma24 family protein